MAASDAKPVPLKNTAFRVSFDIENVTNGALITTWAGMDSTISKDGENYAACTNEATEIQTSGTGFLDLTAAEMNADTVIVKVTVTNTNARVVRLYFNPVESADIPVNATAISGDTVAADNLELQFDGTGLTGNNYPATQVSLQTVDDEIEIISADAATGATQSTAVVSRFGAISGQAGNQLDDWLLAMAADGATAPATMSSAGFNPTTDSLEAIRDRGDAAWVTGSGGATAADVWTYGTRTLTSVDATVKIINPFTANIEKITIGYGEDRTTGSPNGALALTTVASVDLEAVGSTIYFAVRRKSDPATADALFTLTGTATDTLAYTVELSKTYTRQLMPGTYLWSAWHLDASGDRTNLGSGAYVVEDLVQPTV